MTIGSRLKHLRLAKGMTQPEFAALVGTTKQYVSQLESGKNATPNGQLLEAWSRACGVSLQWLATGKGIPEPASHPSGPDRDSLRGALHSVKRLTESMGLDFGSGDEVGAIMRAYDHLAAGEPQDDLLPAILGYVEENGGSFHVRRKADGRTGAGAGGAPGTASGKGKP